MLIFKAMAYYFPALQLQATSGAWRQAGY